MENCYSTKSGDFAERGKKQGKEGMDAMRKLVKRKMKSNDLQSLPISMQEFIKRVQDGNPDAKIFIIE